MKGDKSYTGDLYNNVNEVIKLGGPFNMRISAPETILGIRVIDYAYNATTGLLETITDFSNQPGPTEYSKIATGRFLQIRPGPDRALAR